MGLGAVLATEQTDIATCAKELSDTIDGQAGSDHDDVGDSGWWRSYTEGLERIARRLADE